jgi:AcrR family transcriptional regulator
LLAERSWDGFTMRDVAGRAGLSAGAVYQYFDAKHHIFTDLYEARLRAELDTIRALPPDAGLAVVVGRIVEDFADIYRRLGRHQLAWAADGMPHSPALARLTTTFRALAAVVEQAITRAAAVDGRALRAGPGFLPYLWAVCNGVGDQLVDDRYRIHQCTRDEFLAFSVDAAVAGLSRAT